MSKENKIRELITLTALCTNHDKTSHSISKVELFCMTKEILWNARSHVQDSELLTVCKIVVSINRTNQHDC